MFWKYDIDHYMTPKWKKKKKKQVNVFRYDRVHKRSIMYARLFRAGLILFCVFYVNIVYQTSTQHVRYVVDCLVFQLYCLYTLSPWIV